METVSSVEQGKGRVYMCEELRKYGRGRGWGKRIRVGRGRGGWGGGGRGVFIWEDGLVIDFEGSFLLHEVFVGEEGWVWEWEWACHNDSWRRRTTGEREGRFESDEGERFERGIGHLVQWGGKD